MSQIAVNHLEQGMVLSEDVLDLNERLLLAKGQKIEAKHLRVLKIWGIAQVNVVGESKADATEETRVDTDKAIVIRDRIDFLFKNVEKQHRAIQEIYRSAFLYRYRELPKDVCRLNPLCSHSPEHVQSPGNVSRRIQTIDIKLPEAPSIITDLNNVTSDPYATSSDIARVVHKSPSLSSLLLKIVNSSFYGFPSRIDQISRAVTMIGTKEISCLAVGICVMKEFSDISPDILDMNSFIRHSYASGLIARILAARLNIPQTERLFVAGLLHDIGKLLIYKYFPKHAQTIFSMAHASRDSVCHAEKTVMGLSHAQIGMELLKKWQLPEELQDAVAAHHSPSKATHQTSAVLVQMADLMANAMGWGGSGEQTLVGFDNELWDNVGIPNAVLSVIVRQAQHQLSAMESTLNAR